MELRHLRYFITVAEELNFTRAALRLGIEQPPLSQQIRQLEVEVGTTLFSRHARGVKLTAAGEAFLAGARDIMGRVSETTGAARAASRGESGRIRIGMINSAPFHPFVPRVIRQFGQLYPAVALSLEENSTPGLADALRAGSVDVAFMRPLLDDDRELSIEPLFDEDMVVALPDSHPLTQAPQLPLAALARESFVLFSRLIGSGLYDEIITACGRAGFSPQIRHEVRQVTSIANLVAADMGVSIVPASMQQVAVSGMVYRPISGDAPHARMSLAWRREESAATVNNMRELARRVRDDMHLQGTPAPEH